MLINVQNSNEKLFTDLNPQTAEILGGGWNIDLYEDSGADEDNFIGGADNFYDNATSLAKVGSVDVNRGDWIVDFAGPTQWKSDGRTGVFNVPENRTVISVKNIA